MWARNNTKGGGGGGGHRTTHMGRQQRNSMIHPSKKNTAVGTEAEAKKNMERNAKDFRYPESGFVSPIEHTLVYAILFYPNVYPEDVMLEHIVNEDFHEYMIVKPSTTNHKPSDDTLNGDEEIFSYAQLSALMNLAAERWPPPKQGEDQKRSVPQSLCRSIFQTVVRHAEEHNLDREEEMKELLCPLYRLNEQKANQAGLSVVLPMYLGLGASMITANPLPIWIGYMAAAALSAKNTPGDCELTNMRQLSQAGNRMANVEKTSLLDDSEYD